MTCKDCICYEIICQHTLHDDELKLCESFKNKADFVEVVRCKDCGLKGAAFCMAGDIPLTETTGECFCSYGERKEKNDFKE